MSGPIMEQFRLLLEGAWEHLLAGGAVMIPLALVSLVMWSLMVFKFSQFAALRRGEASLTVCRKDTGKGSVWQREILDGFLSGQGGDADLNRRLPDVPCARIRARSERFVTTILVLASSAPLLGLLGTVTGMITTFDAIQIHGSGNVRALAAGISTALITTQTGLVIAVPGLVLGHFLRRRAQRMAERVDRFRLELLRVYQCAEPDAAPEQAVFEGETA